MGHPLRGLAVISSLIRRLESTLAWRVSLPNPPNGAAEATGVKWYEVQTNALLKFTLSFIEPKTNAKAANIFASLLLGLKYSHATGFLSFPLPPSQIPGSFVFNAIYGHLFKPPHFYCTHRFPLSLQQHVYCTVMGSRKEGSKMGHCKSLRLVAKNPNNTESHNCPFVFSAAIQEDISSDLQHKLWSLSSSWVSST